jgi:serine/threonine-protein kinase
MQTDSRIAGYRLEEIAGRGGMGVVYRATHVGLGRPVALKLIAPDLADDPQFRERFQRESRLAASIDHPNVIPVYEAGGQDGSLFIAMRWVEGDSLETLIRRGAGLEPARAATIIEQVAAALDAAHARGLLHRDVKPANVLVTAGPKEHVYLTDFGLVKRMNASQGLTGSGQLLGTIDYIAPEQIRRKEGDARSDVYSLGCVLFHCLTGRVPFEADDEIAKIYAHLNEQPARPSDLVPELPEALDGVVGRAMAKEPRDRYASAGALGRAVVAAASPPGAGSERATVRRPGVRTSPGDRPTHRLTNRPRRMLGLGLGMAVIAGGVAAVFALENGGGGSHETNQLRATAGLPRDGTILAAPDSGQTYVVKAGAKFVLPRAERAAFGYRPDTARALPRAALQRIPNIPRDGSLLRAHFGTVVWSVRHGERHLITPPEGADVVVIPRMGLRQVPPAANGRRTSVDVTTPSFITERRPFTLAVRLRSPAGVPQGICVVYRIGSSRLMERADLPARDGRCTARLRVSGVDYVRYSVHFVGKSGWRGSKAATRPIPVRPE